MMGEKTTRPPDLCGGDEVRERKTGGPPSARARSGARRGVLQLTPASSRRERRRKGMLIVSSTGVVLASLAALVVYFGEGQQGRNTGLQEEAAGPGGSGCPLDQRNAEKKVVVDVERLRREYLGDPSVPQYFKLLASSLSHMLREPVAALVEHVHSTRSGWDERGHQEVGGVTLVDADCILKNSVLNSLWEQLSATFSEAGEAPPRDAGHITSSEARDLSWWVRYPRVRLVCEIGFNAGHSAAAILLADRNVSLLSIDLGEHRHVVRAASLISSLFPGRFKLELGDSVPIFAELGRQGAAQCDMTRIDGSHLGTPSPAPPEQRFMDSKRERGGLGDTLARAREKCCVNVCACVRARDIVSVDSWES